jgi:hypothetical protein
MTMISVHFVDLFTSLVSVASLVTFRENEPPAGHPLLHRSRRFQYLQLRARIFLEVSDPRLVDEQLVARMLKTMIIASDLRAF